MGDPQESSLFIPSFHVEKKAKPRKKKASTISIIAGGAGLALLAWTVWISITIHQDLDQDQETILALEELLQHNTSALEEDRKPRFLDALSLTAYTAAVANLLCKGVMAARTGIDLGPLGSIEGLDETYNHQTRQMEEAKNNTKQLYEDMKTLNKEIVEKKEEITFAYELYSRSLVNVKNWISILKIETRKQKLYSRKLKNDPALNLTVSEFVNKTLKDLGPQPTRADLVKIGVALDISAVVWSFAGDWMLETGNWVLSSLGDWATMGEATIGWLGDIMVPLATVYNLYRTGNCIWDHWNLHATTKQALDEILERERNATDAKKELEHLKTETDRAIETMYNEMGRLVTIVNEYLDRTGVPCKSTIATIDNDVQEMNDLWQVIERDGDLRRAASKVAKRYKRSIEAGGDQVSLSKRALQEMFDHHEYVDPDSVVKVMKMFGFVLPHEHWSEWNKGDIEACRCGESIPTNECYESWSRTCTSFDEETNRPRCIGEEAIEVNICKINPGSLAFMKACEDRDAAFVNGCRSTLDQLTIADAANSQTGIMAQQIQAHANHTQCYQNCKTFPGATACQFNRDVCQLGGRCTGPCFVITEKVEENDRMGTMKKTCFVFKSPNSGTAENVLEEIVASTQKMFRDRNFDKRNVAAWKFSMSMIDVDLVESQQNAWKEMIKYQSFSADLWGGNPSIYRERIATPLHMVIDEKSTTLEVFEPCNYASNFAYYTLMSQTNALKKMPSSSRKALGQAAAGLTLGSSFFHASHTRLGQELDNLMIKIIAYTLYETYINSLNLPNDTSSVITQLKSSNRDMTGVQLAQFMTDLFRRYPAETWLQQIQALDVPRYETTFGALVLAMCANTESLTNIVCNIENDLLLKYLPMKPEDKNFLKGALEPELKNVLNSRSHHRSEEPEYADKMSAGLKLLAAFVFQETVDDLEVTRPFFELVGLQNFNAFLDDYNTLQPGDSELRGQDWSYPGQASCTSDHAVWHTQSARGLLDLFKLVDELVKRQQNRP